MRPLFGYPKAVSKTLKAAATAGLSGGISLVGFPFWS
jgi:hypothetical protein